MFRRRRWPTVCSMSSAPRPTSTTTLGVLRRQPRYLRAVVALGLFSVAEHAAWVTFLVVAYGRGGVREAGIVSALLLVPAALVAPLVAKEVSGLRLRHPLAAGYVVQCLALVVTASVVVASAAPAVFYMAAVLTTVTTVFSRPVHHGAISSSEPEMNLAANVATGFVSGLAQLFGPLMASAVLLRFGVVEVFVIGAALLAVATTLTVGIGMPAPTRSNMADTLPTWPPQRPSMRRVLLATPEREAAPSVVVLFFVLGLTTVVLGVVETLATDVGYGLVGDGGAGTGALIAGAGGGLLAGASIAGVALRRWSERATMRLGTVVTGVALVLCVQDAGLAWSVAAFVFVGAGMQMVLVAGWVLLHHHVQPAATCLVFGLLESQQLLGNAVGAATAGVAIAHFGVWAVVASSGVVLATSTLLLTAPRALQLRAPARGQAA
jgi:predicted MFS family arabinose efflux permease